MTAIEKLIADSGLSLRRFARLVMAARGERTLIRWLKKGPPADVEDWATRDVVRLERRGHLLTITVRAPLDARKDRLTSHGDNRGV